jgi:threonine/homoserine/homoserine lactone efflux protein
MNEVRFDEVSVQMYHETGMCKIILLVLLCLSVLCMVPLMGSHHLASDHLHHDAATSCSACIGAVATSTIVVLFTLFGLSSLIIPATPALKLVVREFHPPRLR